VLITIKILITEKVEGGGGGWVNADNIEISEMNEQTVQRLVNSL
jgi:hypothetical protein